MQGKKINKLTGAAGAWAEQSVGGHWWTFHWGWAPQALCCHSGVYSAAPALAAHSSAHSDSAAAPWFAQHTECPASKRCIFFTWYSNCLHKKTLNVSSRELPPGLLAVSLSSLQSTAQLLGNPSPALKLRANKGCEGMGTRNRNPRAKGKNTRDWQLTLELPGPVLTLYSIPCFKFDPQQVIAFKKS